MDTDQEERLVSAFEKLADAMTRQADLGERMAAASLPMMERVTNGLDRLDDLDH